MVSGYFPAKALRGCSQTPFLQSINPIKALVDGGTCEAGRHYQACVGSKSNISYAKINSEISAVDKIFELSRSLASGFASVITLPGARTPVRKKAEEEDWQCLSTPF